MQFAMLDFFGGIKIFSDYSKNQVIICYLQYHKKFFWIGLAHKNF